MVLAHNKKYMKQTVEEAAKQGAEGYNIVGQNIYKSGFIVGANWRINSVWHKTKDEVPQLMENTKMNIIRRYHALCMES